MTNPIQKILELGGPVLLLLIIVSIFTLAIFLAKIWQFKSAKVGQVKEIRQAFDLWDAGQKDAAREMLGSTDHYLSSVYIRAMNMYAGSNRRARFEAEAEQAVQPLESKFRVLDMVAQLAPLLGLLGTVLGMIEAFKALQNAGSQVDPSLLAGGIWVALLTTAAGLSVAMPTQMGLTWLESRMDKERTLADYGISVITAETAPATTAN